MALDTVPRTMRMMWRLRWRIPSSLKMALQPERREIHIRILFAVVTITIYALATGAIRSFDIGISAISHHGALLWRDRCLESLEAHRELRLLFLQVEPHHESRLVRLVLVQVLKTSRSPSKREDCRRRRCRSSYRH